MAYKTLTDIIIPAGTVFSRAAKKTVRFIPHYEALIGYGDDHTAHFIVDDDLVKEFDKQFAEIQE